MTMDRRGRRTFLPPGPCTHQRLREAGRRPLALVVTVVALTGWAFARAEAATFTVDCTMDDVDAAPGDGICATATGTCTLRAAIQETNALPGPDSIILPAGTYTLTIPGAGEDLAATGDLDITDDLDIRGADDHGDCANPDDLEGGVTTIIDGNALDRVFDVHGFHDFSIADLTIQHGSASDVPMDADVPGSGVLTRFDAAVTIERSVIVANSGVCAIGGDTVTLINTSVHDNLSTGVCAGVLVADNTSIHSNMAVAQLFGFSVGGILGAVAQLTNVTVDRNPGVGIYARRRLTVSASVINSNGLGIVNGGGGVTVTGSTISRNGGPGIVTTEEENGTAVADSSVTANGGGGIRVGGIDRSALVMNSTISGNSVDGDGGGIWFAGSCGGVAVINSTISGNSATGSGGGIYGAPCCFCNNSLLVNNATIAANTADSDGDGVGDGGGIFTVLPTPENARVLIANSLVGDNIDTGGEAPDCGGVISSEGYNLIENPAGCKITGDTTGNLIGVNPRLGRLRHNGAPTKTHALLPGSPAIDAGNPAGCSDFMGEPITTDQRGVARPQGAACDIGAYEFACGNGVVDLGEQCDDGNSVNGDGCSSACRIENRPPS